MSILPEHMSDDSGARRSYAPRTSRGYAYVVTTRTPFRRTPYVEVVFAASLAQAKARYGWTREPHTSKSVRRATVQDLEATS